MPYKDQVWNVGGLVINQEHMVVIAATAVLCGLLYLVFDGAFTALGESGAAPAALAAWAAPAMFAALGLSALVYMEG